MGFCMEFEDFLDWVNKNVSALVFLTCFVLPVIMFFLKNGFMGYDSYYFLKEICFGNPLYTNAGSPLFDYLRFYIPCNEILIKTMLVSLFGISLAAIYWVGKLFDRKAGVLLVLFTGIAPILINNSFKFENDNFAFPLIYLSFLLMLIFAQKRKILAFITSLVLLAIAAGFWGGTVYLLIPYLAFAPASLLLLIPIILLKQEEFFGHLTPKFLVSENHPIKALLNLVFYWVFLMFSSGHRITKEKLGLATIIAIIISFLNPKLMIIFIPLFGLMILQVYDNASEINKKKIICLALVFNVAWGLSINGASNSPTDTELIGAQETVKYAKENNLIIRNDWGLGHLILYYGGETPNHSYYSKQSYLQEPNSAVLSRIPLDCFRVKEFDYPLMPFVESLTLYHC